MSSALFINAKVWQPYGSFTESFGFNNGHIDFSGSNTEANTLRNNYSEIIDLKGKLVLPGLTDGHLHLVNGALMMKKLDCSKIDSVSELKDSITKYLKNHNVSWVIGGNLDLNRIFSGHSKKNGNVIDEIFSELPLYITNYDYHSAICNTKALVSAGINHEADNFPKDEAEVSSTGELTGFISESVMNMVYNAIPPASLDEKVNAVSDCIAMLHKYGITSVSDITLPEDIEVYIELWKQEKLKIRINSYIPFTEFENLQSYRDKISLISKDYFTICGFKAFWDGALGSETALFSLNYKGKGHSGFKTELVKSKRIFELAKNIDKAGCQIIIHAIGNKAINDVLDLYASLENTKKLRHRVEHAQHINPKNYKRFGKLGVIASVQPIHLKYDARTVKEKLPEELVPDTHNYINIINSEGIVNFGTDFPIVEADPFENIRLAVTRITNEGEFTPEHKIPLHECLKAYTINNAYSNHNEFAAGSISKGKVADFVIMNDDLFEMDEQNIGNAKVYKTFLSGVNVYSEI